MKILRFSWLNFRNLTSGELRPCGGVNVLWGGNAQGKTNLLEGMWLFTGERSFRGAKDAEMVRAGCAESRLRLDFYGGGRGQTAQIRIAAGRRSAQLNGVPQRSCAAMIGEFRAAVFSPEHLSLLSGGPARRRNFIDAAVCQLRPACAAVFAEYGRALAQRNALLKDIPAHAELLDTLDIWDARLARSGEAVMRARQAYAQALAGPAARFYAGMCGGREALSLRYEKNAGDLAAALRRSRREDLLTGHTGVGPHRDDLAVEISGMGARAYASQGQKRSAVIALKLAEAELLARRTGEPPVVFLDDVLSELDGERQSYLLNRLRDFQVFVTCCEPVPGGPPASGREPEPGRQPDTGREPDTGRQPDTGRRLFHVQGGVPAQGPE